MLKLMNSAMMPSEGNYSLRRLTEDEFVASLQREAGDFESYIGYQQTADHIARLTGIPVPLNRAQTTLGHGDSMLICKLAYRVSDPARKGEPMPDDWEYFEATYSTETEEKE